MADARPLRTLESFTVQAFVWPTTPLKGKQALISKWSAEDKSGFAVIIDETGSVALELGDGKGAVERLSVGHGLQLKRWYRVGAAYDAATGAMRFFSFRSFRFPISPTAGVSNE